MSETLEGSSRLRSGASSISQSLSMDFESGSAVPARRTADCWTPRSLQRRRSSLERADVGTSVHSAGDLRIEEAATLPEGRTGAMPSDSWKRTSSAPDLTCLGDSEPQSNAVSALSSASSSTSAFAASASSKFSGVKSSSFSAGAAGASQSPPPSSPASSSRARAMMATCRALLRAVPLVLWAAIVLLGVGLVIWLAESSHAQALGVDLSSWCFFLSAVFFSWVISEYFAAAIVGVGNFIDMEGKVEMYLQALVGSLHYMLFFIAMVISWNALLYDVDGVPGYPIVEDIAIGINTAVYISLLHGVKAVFVTHFVESRNQTLFAKELQLALFREKLLTRLSQKQYTFRKQNVTRHIESSSSIDDLKFYGEMVPSLLTLAESESLNVMSLSKFRLLRDLFQNNKLKRIRKSSQFDYMWDEEGSKADVERVVRRVYWNLAQPLSEDFLGVDDISNMGPREMCNIQDFARVLHRDVGSAVVQKAFSLFSHGKNDFVTRDDIETEVTSAYKSRKHLSNNLRNFEDVSRILMRVVDFPFWFIMVIALLVSFGYDLVTVVVPFSSFVLGVAFAVRPLGQRMFESAVLMIGVQSFSIGDRIRISGQKQIYTIRKVGVFSTIAHSIQGEEVYIPNTMLFNQHVHNLRRNPLASVSIDLQAGLQDVAEKLPQFKRLLGDYLRANNHVWIADGFCVETTSIDNLSKVVLAVYVGCRCRWQDRKIWMPARSSLLEHIAYLFQQLKMEYLPPTLPVDLYPAEEELFH
eukprot:ANDGO_08615.mRNA.1 Mechanosensitive ion channel protein 10